MKPHDGQVVLVTGAARGIGRAVAVMFAERGADLIICDLAELMDATHVSSARTTDLYETERLVRAAGARCVLQWVDVRDQTSIDVAVLAGLDAYGHIDVAVANASVMHAQPFAEIDDTSWTTMIDVNLSGVWRTAKAVTPHMVQRRAGVFLATGAPESRIARHDLACYTAAKHGLAGLMKSLALELGVHDVRVNTVLSGVTDAPVDSFSVRGRRLDDDEGHRRVVPRSTTLLNDGDPLPAAAVAEAMCWLAGDAAAHITGVELPVDGGALTLTSPHLPRGK